MKKLFCISLLLVTMSCTQEKVNEILGTIESQDPIGDAMFLTKDGRLAPSPNSDKKADQMAKDKHIELGDCKGCHPKMFK